MTTRHLNYIDGDPAQSAGYGDLTVTWHMPHETRAKTFKVKEADYEAWLGGKVIQAAFPYLSDDDREFIQTGITPEEWDELCEFSEPDNIDDDITF